MRQCFCTLFAVFLLLPVFRVSAQTAGVPPCGNLFIPANYYYEGYEEYIEPITNCANPLNADTSVSFSATLQLADQVVAEGSVITVPADVSAVPVTFTMDRHSFGAPLDIYRREGVDYRLVYTAFDNVSAPTSAPLSPGLYTAAFVYEEAPVFNQAAPTWWQQIKNFLIPTAFASYPNYKQVQVINFEIKATAAVPTGASSVLFLPGIMGSRLYEEGTACGGSGEQERWFSTSECDQLRLLTDYTGKSINPVYTKASESSVIAATRVGLGSIAITSPLYRSFLTELAQWKQSGEIADYVAFPYDWRMRLDDLLKAKRDLVTGKVTYDITNTFEDGYVYQTLKDLVAHSKSGKVTIVAHSNGGLLAKTLLATLQSRRDPLLDKIDVVILVAVPQVGTPDALVGMLQGEEIGPAGLVVSQKTARQLMNTMPFAYHLLPNASYFNGSGVAVRTPAIKFINGTATTPWMNTYGETIADVNKMQAFLRKESGRTMPAWSDLLTPAVVDGYLFNYTNTIEQVMNSWVPASTTKVYEIAGTGIGTPAGLLYYTGTTCATKLLWVCTSYQPVLAYTVKQTFDGDGTVVVPSALAMSTNLPNVERLWLNLKTYNNDVIADRIHRDIFEVPDVIQFVKNTLKASPTATYTYLGTTAPLLTATDRLVFTLHSPLDMSLKLASGAVVSSSTAMVEGAEYHRYGEVQSISIPDTASSKTLLLRGVTGGSFTLDIEQQRNGITTKHQTFAAIPSSSSTIVSVPITSSLNLASTTLALDYDGNGSVDVSYVQTGEVVTYTLLRNTITSLTVVPLYKTVLLETLKIAEQNNQKASSKNSCKVVERVTLQALKQQILVYAKLKLISVSDQQKIVSMIDVLLSK